MAIRKSSGRDARAPSCQDTNRARQEKAGCLSPEHLGALAKRLAKSAGANESARLRERLTRGFYGI